MSLNENFNDIAKDQKHQEQYDDDVEVDEAEEKDWMNERKLFTDSEEFKLNPSQQEEEHRKRHHRENLTATLSSLIGL